MPAVGAHQAIAAELWDGMDDTAREPLWAAVEARVVAEGGRAPFVRRLVRERVPGWTHDGKPVPPMVLLVVRSRLPQVALR